MHQEQIPEDVLDAWLHNRPPHEGEAAFEGQEYEIKCLKFTFIGKINWSQSYYQYIFSLVAVRSARGEWRGTESVVNVEDFSHICMTLVNEISIFALEGLYPDPSAGTEQIGEVWIHNEVTQLNPRSGNQ